MAVMCGPPSNNHPCRIGSLRLLPCICSAWRHVVLRYVLAAACAMSTWMLARTVPYNGGSMWKWETKLTVVPAKKLFSFHLSLTLLWDHFSPSQANLLLVLPLKIAKKIIKTKQHGRQQEPSFLFEGCCCCIQCSASFSPEASCKPRQSWIFF